MSLHKENQQTQKTVSISDGYDNAVCKLYSADMG